MVENLYPLLAGLFIMVASLSGVIFSYRTLGRWLERRLTYLATFAGGVFAVVTYHLIEEILHETTWQTALLSVVSGFLLMQILVRLAPSHHHHHDVKHSHAHSHVEGRGVLVSDALHNVGDGIILVGAFAVDLWIGIAAAFGILIHEVVQEISEYFVLREAGYSPRAALVRNFAVSSTILVGIAGASYFEQSPLVIIALSGIAAGGFLSVIFSDLMPHARHSVRHHGGNLFMHVGVAILGVLVMLSAQTLIPHEEHDEEERALATANLLVR